MRTFHCRCGTDIDIITPSPHAGYLVLDSDVDLSIDNRIDTIRSFLTAVRDGERVQWLASFYGEDVPHSRISSRDDAEVIEDILSQHDAWTRHMFRCPICGRIYIQRQPGVADFRCYDEET